MVSKRHIVMLCIITAFVLSTTYGHAASYRACNEPTGTLSGFVTDAQMNPLSAACVRVYFHETYEENYSDALGYFHVTNIPLCYCLKNATCSKPGYLPEWVVLSIGENTVYDFVLLPLSEPYPVFNGTLGNNGIYISCVIVSFANIDSIDTLYYRLDGSAWNEYTEPFMVCESGMHSLCWYWTYQGNQSGEKMGSLKIDQEDPLLDLSSQKIGIYKIKITAVVNDAHSGVDRVEFFIDGEPLGVVYEFPYDTMFIGIGTHYVKAIAYDRAGNFANSTLTTSCASQRLLPYRGSFAFQLFVLRRLMQLR